jgi:O-antigen/teichoic acid export membrane protein
VPGKSALQQNPTSETPPNVLGSRSNRIGSDYFVMTSIGKRLAAGGAWAFAGQIITVFSVLAVNALLARLLAPEEVGSYFLTASLVWVSAAAAQLGLHRAVVRLIAESLARNQPGRAAKAVRLVLRLGALGAFLVAGMLLLGVGDWLAMRVFDSILIANVTTLASLWVVVFTFQGLLAESFRGFHDVRLATFFGGVITSLLSAVLFAGLRLVHSHGNLEQVIMLSIIAGTINVVIAFKLLRNKLKPLGKADQLDVATVVNVAWPMWITTLTLIALTQADLWIVGIFRTQDEVAVYGAAARLVAVVAMPLTIVNAVVPSFIAEMYAKHARQDLESALRGATTLASIPALLVVVIFMFLAGPILGIVYGEYYRQGATVLILLGMGQLVNVCSGSCGVVLMMTGHQVLMMSITIACGALTVMGAVLFVQPYGVTGVASVAAATMLLQNVLMLFFSKLKIGIWTHARLPVLYSPR